MRHYALWYSGLKFLLSKDKENKVLGGVRGYNIDRERDCPEHKNINSLHQSQFNKLPVSSVTTLGNLGEGQRQKSETDFIVCCNAHKLSF